MKKKEEKDEGRGGRLKRQLRSVRKRKHARRSNFECEVVMSKMKLVKIEADSDH